MSLHLTDIARVIGVGVAVGTFVFSGLRSATVSAKLTELYNSALPVSERRYPRTSWEAASLRRRLRVTDPTSELLKQWDRTIVWMILAFLLAALCLFIGN